MSDAPIIESIPAQADGWTAWQAPVPTGYLMSCCDCGLVHEVEFKTVRIIEHKTDGEFQADDLDPESYRALLRMKRRDDITKGHRMPSPSGPITYRSP